MEALPILLFWGLALWALFGKAQVQLYLFFGSMAFGAFAVIPSELTGGLTFTPTPMVLMLIIARSLCSPGGFVFFATSALSPKRLLLLLLFWITAILATMFLPRFFAGEIIIIPVRLELSTFGEPLFPTTQNISQLAYMTISIFAVFAFARLLRDPLIRQHALKAMCVGAGMAVFTGLLDFASGYVGLDPILSPFRTASYSLMTEVQIMGGKRVVGLMPEASAYGGLCVMFLSLTYFFRYAMLKRQTRERTAPILILLLIAMIWLSTSSASYVGLFVFLLCATIEWTVRKGTRRAGRISPKGMGVEFWTAWTLLVVVGCVVLFAPSLLDPIVEKVNEMVLNKSQTSSFEERSMWTATGWNALIDTWGLGVGIGATRTSNFAAAVFSNTGLIGGLLYFGFVLQTVRRKLSPGADPASQVMLGAVRYAFIPSFIVALLTATTPDFGSYNAFLFGIALAVVISDLKRQREIPRPTPYPLAMPLSSHVSHGMPK